MDYFNFCHCCLNPSVKSSAVSAEGYDVNNLISGDLNDEKKGFMVYRTINPPVDVTFTFMCKINISHIIIWPQVGNQKSTGFQIFTKCGKGGGTHSNESFIHVGTAFLQNEPGVVFHHAYEPSNSTISNFLRRRLTSRQNSLSAVSAVQIKIMKTHRSSVPAILKVEIWGLPCVSCPKAIRMRVVDLWTQKSKKIDVKVPEKKSEESELRSTALSLVSNNFEVPEDFLDPITCEIMVLPFILPSGKIVDQRTLEKHENHEANWGRRPSDPFTGKLFTETSRPVPATALKARIDKFLIEHANVDELKKIPRTVGRQFNSNRLKGSSTKLVPDDSQHSSSKTDHTKSCIRRVTNKSIESSDEVVLVDKRKAKFDLTEFGHKKLKIDNACTSSIETEFSNNFLNVEPASSKDSSKRSHEDLLNDSLDAALKNALSGLPSFTNFTPKINENENKCSLCGESENLYILPCQHLLCRNCLTNRITDKNCKCSCCDLTFDSSGPKRYFS